MIDKLGRSIEDNLKSIKLGVAIIYVCFLSILIPIILVFFYAISNNLPCFNGIMQISGVNELGDFMGGVLTPVLTFIGFIVICLSYETQKEELKSTREALNISIKELELTREEIKNNALLFEKQLQQINKSNRLEMDKYCLDMFYAIYNSWKKSFENVRYKTYFNVTKRSDDSYKLSANRKGNQPISIEVDADKYGYILYAIISILVNGKYFGVLKGMQPPFGELEYNQINENLSLITQDIVKGYENIVNYIMECECSERTQTFMKTTIIAEMTWPKKFILNMIVNDIVFGTINKDDNFRVNLLSSLEMLGLKIDGFEGFTKERFVGEQYE